MASRWMQAKLYKIKKARLFSPHDTKNRAGFTIAASNALSVEAATLREGYTGAVTVGEDGRREQAIGKTRRVFDARTYGNGTRKVTSAAEYYSLWDTSDRLIRNGAVIA